MAYILEVCRAGATIEITKKHSRRYPPPGTGREKKQNPTTEAQEQVNARQAETRIRRDMNHNFRAGDLYITLDYEKDKRPEDGEEMRSHGDKLKRDLRRIYRKKGIELKYMYVMERGSRGAMHHHILISAGADLEELRKIWPYGRIHVDPLDGSGQYRKLASYFIKYAIKTRHTDEKLMNRYCETSRNLVHPPVKKVLVHRKHWRREVPARKGYYLDKDTEQHYIDQFGFEAMKYTLVRIPEGKEKQCRRIST
jgi:hypothetical protein